MMVASMELATTMLCGYLRKAIQRYRKKAMLDSIVLRPRTSVFSFLCSVLSLLFSGLLGTTIYSQ